MALHRSGAARGRVKPCWCMQIGGVQADIEGRHMRDGWCGLLRDGDSPRFE